MKKTKGEQLMVFSCCS